jgi:hypothetical protein
MRAFEDEIFSKFVRTPTSHDPVDIFGSVLIQQLQLQRPPPSHLWRAVTSTALIKPNEGLLSSPRSPNPKNMGSL